MTVTPITCLARDHTAVVSAPGRIPRAQASARRAALSGHADQACASANTVYFQLLSMTVQRGNSARTSTCLTLPVALRGKSSVRKIHRVGTL